MTLSTLFRYLLGDRAAILEIASNRHSLWIGLLFVLSAGFAREYDAEDLLHEPWHLLLPLGASLVASGILYFLAQFVGSRNAIPVAGLLSGYLSFLGLFWLTAPLAWLYVGPYERFLSPAEAIDLNLLTLMLVAGWRVMLMIRVLCVCMDVKVRTSICTVLAFGSIVYLVTSAVMAGPAFAIMGGLHSFEEKTSLQQAFEGPVVLTIYPGIILLIIAFCSSSGKHIWTGFIDPQPPLGIGLVVLAAGSLLVWLPILPFTQPEQQRRHQVESAIRRADYGEAVAVLTAHPRQAFPPVWTPPPHNLTYVTANASFPVVLGMLEEVKRQDGPAWVRELYARRLAWLANESSLVKRDEALRRRIHLLIESEHVEP